MLYFFIFVSFQMKTAIVGSRTKTVDLAQFLKAEKISEIISGGACGVDKCAEKFAQEKKLPLTIFLPDYKKFGSAAPHIRNRKIVAAADCVAIFWDGKSKGTASVITLCKKLQKPHKIFQI